MGSLVNNAIGLMNILTAQSITEKRKKNRAENKEFRNDVCLHDDTKVKCGAFAGLCVRTYEKKTSGAKYLEVDGGKVKVESFYDCLDKAPVFGATVKDPPDTTIWALSGVSKFLGRVYEKRNELILPKGLSKNDVIDEKVSAFQEILGRGKVALSCGSGESEAKISAKLYCKSFGVMGANPETGKSWSNEICTSSIKRSDFIYQDNIGDRKVLSPEYRNIAGQKTPYRWNEIKYNPFDKTQKNEMNGYFVAGAFGMCEVQKYSLGKLDHSLSPKIIKNIQEVYKVCKSEGADSCLSSSAAKHARSEWKKYVSARKKLKELHSAIEVRKRRFNILESTYKGVAELVTDKDGLAKAVAKFSNQTKNLKTWADYDVAEQALQSMLDIAMDTVNKFISEKKESNYRNQMVEKTGWFESLVDQVRGSVATKKGPLHDRNRFIESFDEYVGNISEGRTVLQQYCSAKLRFEVAKAIHHYATRYCLIPKTRFTSWESELVEKQEQVADYSKRSMSGGPGTRTETKQVWEKRGVGEVKICDNYDRDHIAKAVSREMKISTCEKPELWQLEEKPDFEE